MIKKLLAAVMLITLLFGTGVSADTNPDISADLPSASDSISQSEYRAKNRDEAASPPRTDRAAFPNQGHGGIPPQNDGNGNPSSPPQTAQSIQSPQTAQNSAADSAVSAAPKPQSSENNTTETIAPDVKNRADSKTASEPPADFNENNAGKDTENGGNPFRENGPPSGINGNRGGAPNTHGNAENEQPQGFWNFIKTYFTPIFSVLLLIPAFLFVIFYH